MSFRSQTCIYCTVIVRDIIHFFLCSWLYAYNVYWELLYLRYSFPPPLHACTISAAHTFTLLQYFLLFQLVRNFNQRGVLLITHTRLPRPNEHLKLWSSLFIVFTAPPLWWDLVMSFHLHSNLNLRHIVMSGWESD